MCVVCSEFQPQNRLYYGALEVEEGESTQALHTRRDQVGGKNIPKYQPQNMSEPRLNILTRRADRLVERSYFDETQVTHSTPEAKGRPMGVVISKPGCSERGSIFLLYC